MCGTGLQGRGREAPLRTGSGLPRRAPDSPPKEPICAGGLQRKPMMTISCPLLREPSVAISARDVNAFGAAPPAEEPWEVSRR